MKTFLRILFFFLLVTQICFAQWYQQNSGTTKNIKALYFIDENNGWAVGDSGLIIHTTNGGQNWVVQTSISTASLNDICFIDSEVGLIAGGNLDVPDADGAFIQTWNGGIDWIAMEGLEGVELRSLSFINSGSGWIVGSFITPFGRLGIICTYGVNGYFYFRIDTISPDYNYTDVCYTDEDHVVIIGDRTGLGYGFGDTKILRTTDGGNFWTSLDTDLNDIFFLDSKYGWGVGQLRGRNERDYILSTTDFGENWLTTYLDTSYVTYYDHFNEIFFTDTTTGWIVGTNGKILKTVDCGQIWNLQQSTVIEDLNDVFFSNNNNGWIVGDNGTILHTTNGGVTFIEEEQIDVIPTEFLLSQNYPNPFNSSSVIKYSIPKSSQVTLKIFNALGSRN